MGYSYRPAIHGIHVIQQVILRQHGIKAPIIVAQQSCR